MSVVLENGEADPRFCRGKHGLRPLVFLVVAATAAGDDVLTFFFHFKTFPLLVFLNAFECCVVLGFRLAPADDIEAKCEDHDDQEAYKHIQK